MTQVGFKRFDSQLSDGNAHATASELRASHDDPVDMHLSNSEILAKYTKTPDVGTEAIVDREATNIKQAFTIASDNVQFTSGIIKSILAYMAHIRSKDDHIAFFGGNLLGTDRIRFYDGDRDRWFDEVLGVDEEYLRETVHALPSIVKDWKVTSDVFNICCVWVVHKLIERFGLKDKKAYAAMIDTLVLLQFRFMSSAYTNFFPRQVDLPAAEATYAALSLKFKIKQLGSWGALFRDRAELMIAKDSIHINTFKRFDKDSDILYIVTDISTRTRKTIKDQYVVLDQVRSGNLRTQQQSSLVEFDGETIIRDKVSAYNNARYYIQETIEAPASFIKQELVGVILDMMPTVSEAALRDLLIYLSTARGKERKVIDDVVDKLLLYTFDYIAKNRLQFSDAGGILIKMKLLYTAAKAYDKNILSVRKDLEKIVKKQTHLKSDSAVAAARTSIMLYLLLRTLASNMYK